MSEAKAAEAKASEANAAYACMPLGLVIRQTPGATRWAAWSFRATAVLPFAPASDWRLLRQDGDVSEYHAATRKLELFRAEAEAYAHALEAREPSVWAVLRPRAGTPPLDVLTLTASPYEAQDYLDNGEDIVERIAMPPGLRDWVAAFVAQHHRPEPFRKRRRGPRASEARPGGDPRTVRGADVYRAPGNARSSA